jgi:hypothetical protein
MWTNKSWEDQVDIFVIGFEDWMSEQGMTVTIRTDKKTEPNK